jgi:peptidoglycan/LPS O-acetylase OafA/YrhL
MIFERSLLIDFFKVFGAQLIFFHHLALYSPMAKILETELPALIDFFVIHAKLPVSSFLVVGGYLCAKNLFDERLSISLLDLISRRCARLLPLYFFSIFAVIVVTIFWQSYLQDELWISATPSLYALAAHLLLLQDLIGVPALSAGAWYVSIDLQLYTLALAVFLISRFVHSFDEEIIGLVFFVLSVVSLFLWSKDNLYDVCALYFIQAYGIGILAHLGEKNRLNFYFFLSLLFLLAADAFFQSSLKSCVIFLTAFLIFFMKKNYLLNNYFARLFGSASNASYAFFISHFFVIIIFTGMWKMLALEGFVLAGLFFLATWVFAFQMSFLLNSLYIRGRSFLSK